MAVVTASLRGYATRVLEQFGVEYDVLVAYQDTQAYKPSPEPFNLAVRQLGVRADECLCVGDDPGDTQAAYHARIPSVGALWRFASGYNDPLLKEFWKASPERAIPLPAMLLRPDLLEGCRYIGEAILDNVPYHEQVGRRLFCANQQPAIASSAWAAISPAKTRGVSAPVGASRSSRPRRITPRGRSSPRPWPGSSTATPGSPTRSCRFRPSQGARAGSVRCWRTWRRS